MADIEQYVMVQLINIIRSSPEWVREAHPHYQNINNITVRDTIRIKFPQTSIRYWKKEYAKWFYRDGSIVSIHRFVNHRNRREEFGVKIKWISQGQEIKRLINEIRADNQGQVSEVTEYHKQAAASEDGTVD